MKSRLFRLTLCILLALACSMGIALSAESEDPPEPLAEAIITNALRVGLVQGTLDEEYETTTVILSIEEPKEVWVTNQSTVHTFMRVLVETYWVDPSLVTPADPTAPVAVLDFLTINGTTSLPDLSLNEVGQLTSPWYVDTNWHISHAEEDTCLWDSCPGYRVTAAYYYYIYPAEPLTNTAFLDSFTLNALTNNLSFEYDGVIRLTLECVQADSDFAAADATWVGHPGSGDIGWTYTPWVSGDGYTSTVTFEQDILTNYAFTFSPPDATVAAGTGLWTTFAAVLDDDQTVEQPWPQVPSTSADDIRTQETITVTNSTSDRVAIFLEILGAHGTPTDAQTELLEKTWITVSDEDDSILWEGYANQTSEFGSEAKAPSSPVNTENPIPLGIFAAGDSKTLTVTSQIDDNYTGPMTGDPSPKPIPTEVTALVDWRFSAVPAPGTPFQFRKVTDAALQTGLNGVVFTLKDTTTEVEYTVTSTTITRNEQSEVGWVTLEYDDNGTTKPIPPGEYIMTEQAPAGYYGEGPWQVTIDDQYDAIFDPELNKFRAVVIDEDTGDPLPEDTSSPPDYYYVLNTPGFPLPLTGGSGTFLLILYGSTFTLLSGAFLLLLLAQKRRMRIETPTQSPPPRGGMAARSGGSSPNPTGQGGADSAE